MNHPLPENTKGLEEYQKLYGRILRMVKEPKGNRKIRTKFIPKVNPGDQMRFKVLLNFEVVTVNGNYVPPSRGMRDSLGGIAGAGPALEPDEPSDFEVETITNMDGQEIEVNDSDLDKIIDLGIKIGEHQRKGTI